MASIGSIRDKYKELKEKKGDITEILADQYSDICSQPRTDPNDDMENINFENITMNREMVIKAIKELPGKSGPGPDGVPPKCLINGGEFILAA